MKFAELHVGRVIEAGPILVDEASIIEFARQHDPQPFHIDREAASRTRWKGLIASGFHTCALAMSTIVATILHDSESFGSPGLDCVKWPHPVRPGDRLRLRVEVREARRSRSAAVGIVRWQWLLLNQHDQPVLEVVATSLFDLAQQPGVPQPAGAA